MTVVLIKCTIYEDCGHDRNPHKNIMFLSLYMIAIMIPALFLYLSVYKNCEHDHSPHKNTIFSLYCRSPHKYNFLGYIGTVTMIAVHAKCPNIQFLCISVKVEGRATSGAMEKDEIGNENI